MAGVPNRLFPNSNHIISNVDYPRVTSTTETTSESDIQFGDRYVAYSQIDRRLLCATVKAIKSSGTYVFLKLFKTNESGEFISEQRVGLTYAVYEDLIAWFTWSTAAKKNRNLTANQYLLERMVECMFVKSTDLFKRLNKTSKYFTHPTLAEEMIHSSICARDFDKEGTTDYCTSGENY